MKILAIETSCDETGVCLLTIDGTHPNTSVTVEANELATQIEDHQEYGGVFPSLAKRLHGENLPVLLEKILKTTSTTAISQIPEAKKEIIRGWLKRYPDLPDKLFDIFTTHGLPDINAVSVTVGPGLEPALWVGINVARAIALALDVPVIPINHMEGHLISTLVDDDITDGHSHNLKKIDFPAVALLVSGGHTELIKLEGWQSYEKIGQTRDDAAGEAFDKIGRLLDLPYPAGPHVSTLAQKARDLELESPDAFNLPRPMLGSDDLDFSFSGLKTDAARKIKAEGPLADRERQQFARELEDVIVDILVQKTSRAVKSCNAKDLLVGGGVSANTQLRQRLKTIKKDVSVHLSPLSLAGDNAVMIGLAAGGHYESGVTAESEISADSRLSL